jgi:hypothetical protein
VLNAITQVMDAAPENISLTGAPEIFQVIPRTQHVRWDAENGTTTGFGEWFLDVYSGT